MKIYTIKVYYTLDVWICILLFIMYACKLKFIQKIVNSEIKLVNHIRHKIYPGNPFGRKPSWKVRPLCAPSLNGNIFVSTNNYGMWPMGCYSAQILFFVIPPMLLGYFCLVMEQMHLKEWKSIFLPVA